MNISVAESIVSSWGGLHYSTIKIQGEFEASYFLVHAMPPTVGGAAEFVGAEKSPSHGAAPQWARQSMPWWPPGRFEKLDSWKHEVNINTLCVIIYVEIKLYMADILETHGNTFRSLWGDPIMVTFPIVRATSFGFSWLQTSRSKGFRHCYAETQQGWEWEFKTYKNWPTDSPEKLDATSCNLMPFHSPPKKRFKVVPLLQVWLPFLLVKPHILLLKSQGFSRWNPHPGWINPERLLNWGGAIEVSDSDDIMTIIGTAPPNFR